ncbi:carbohydrate sulfotransferase 14-like [Diadema antillarum]|uniref:carbohydrate sulfotransferase 14-like n=1 Tax=Diadema antillarum TaxID=105358 RepID=UPI003A898E53
MLENVRTCFSAGPLAVIILCAVSLAYIMASFGSLASLQGRIPVRASFFQQGSEKWRPPQPANFQNASWYADMMVEQTRRRALVDQACEHANMSRKLDLGIDGKNIFKSVGHLLVDDKYKILFGFIPKVGCTTWKRVMSSLRRTHRGHQSQVSTLKGFRDNLTEITYRLQSYRKVLFVREPITRMLSGYLSKLRNFRRLQTTWERYIGRAIVKRYRGYNHEQRYADAEVKPWMNITLAEYIQFITDIGSNIAMDVLNDHWLPLNVVSNPCQIHYDFIGHYENLAVEAPFAIHWLGVDGLIHFPEVHESHASNSLVEEYSQVPIHLLKKLSTYYSFDYKAFGYRINDTISYLVKGIFDQDEDL